MKQLFVTGSIIISSLLDIRERYSLFVFPLDGGGKNGCEHSGISISSVNRRFGEVRGVGNED